MKILIFSDSHGDTGTMCSVTEKEKPDMIIHLGDGMADAELLQAKYPGIQMIKNLGNVDSDKEEELIKHKEICGKRIVMTHGHTFYHYTFNSETGSNELTDETRVTGRRDILKYMQENNTDIFLHGHTHEPYINIAQASGKTCWIMNPGRSGRMEGTAIKPTYGILKIYESGALEWKIAEA